MRAVRLRLALRVLYWNGCCTEDAPGHAADAISTDPDYQAGTTSTA